ncbi:MAG: tetratricopeptide repeat protein [Proteobacteria bacterium]|jgi:tetratricopeptide (TPR) repeat protein|nr:tetratricopeptide repeat protein [Pseudomonadota bacterium]
MKRLFLILCISIFSLSAQSAEPSFQDSFQKGVSFYRSGYFQKAVEAFAQSVEINPHSLPAITNLALAHFQTGNAPLAIALLRRVQGLDPDFPTAQAAMSFVFSQLKVKEIPHEILLYEQLRQSVLVPVSFNIYFGLLALFLLAAGWSLISYFARRKAAEKAELAPPSLSWTMVFFAAGFLIVTALTILKAYDLTQPRGTIIAEKISVFSGPSPDTVNLFEIYGGLEVRLLRKQDSWIQVSYPGAASGWIESSQVMHTSGRLPW